MSSSITYAFFLAVVTLDASSGQFQKNHLVFWAINKMTLEHIFIF